ncbi:MAG: amidohydrolase family protein [Bryobacteraceae bacterium]|nr:amidohydrolase family protein [Bryobacteraceae bacterium]
MPPQARLSSLLKFADRLGIQRLVLSLGAPLLEDPPPDQLRDVNNQVLEALKSAPDRTVGMVYLNPNHLDFSLHEFDRCVRDGPMVGVKLWVARPSSAPELDPIVERAAAAQAIVYQHSWFKRGGNLPGESTPFDVVELARRHPRANIICGHTGGDWERGIRAVRASPNVPICIAGSHPTAGFLEMAVEELGPERIVYGSDVPGRSFASQLGKVLGADIPGAAKTLILGGNLKRLLTPIMKAKGMRIDS